MTGKQLYNHWKDCLYCETGEVVCTWEELEPAFKKGWERLAQCVTEKCGCSIAWELATHE